MRSGYWKGAGSFFPSLQMGPSWWGAWEQRPNTLIVEVNLESRMWAGGVLLLTHLSKLCCSFCYMWWKDPAAVSWCRVKLHESLSWGRDRSLWSSTLLALQMTWLPPTHDWLKPLSTFPKHGPGMPNARHGFAALLSSGLALTCVKLPMHRKENSSESPSPAMPLHPPTLSDC